ncbi:Adenylate kinase [Tolypocladium paradoxum]|uniref:Adenylate kinase n=1 Tax=Tolypocladium paradoxum TaxID=94208 RepID=A0A2S4KTI1_9HYPO|nr:Adenylate kinase [Tolypocladium paradoxum]
MTGNPANPSQALRAKATELAAAHDVAEAVTGDILPADKVSKESKLSREELAYQFLKSIDPQAGGRFMELWQEYEENQTEAANLVHDADKLQRLDRAFEYARRYPRLDLSDFKNDAGLIIHSHMHVAARDVLRKWTTWEQRSQKFIFVIGGPGVGKGTQCSKAAAALGATHVSAGELLRNEQARPGSPFRDFITQSFEKSIPVPPILITELVQATIQHQPHEVVLLDGFPLSEQQLKFFENEVSEKYGTVSLIASDETLDRRLQERAKSSGRTDDDPKNICKRIEAFSTRSRPILDKLREREREQPFFTVDSEGQVEEVQDKCIECIKAILQHYEQI